MDIPDLSDVDAAALGLHFRGVGHRTVMAAVNAVDENPGEQPEDVHEYVQTMADDVHGEVSANLVAVAEKMLAGLHGEPQHALQELGRA